MYDMVFRLFIYFSYMFLMNYIHEEIIHELLDSLIVVLPECYDCADSTPVSNFRTPMLKFWPGDRLL
jgi:hypothetical protein